MDRQFGRKIVELRRKKGMSQQELAAAAGVTPSAICHIEMGRRIGSHRTLHRLESVLGLERGELASYLPAQYLDRYSNGLQIPVINEQGGLTSERLWLSEMIDGCVARQAEHDNPKELICKGDYLITRPPGGRRIAIVRLCR